MRKTWTLCVLVSLLPALTGGVILDPSLRDEVMHITASGDFEIFVDGKKAKHVLKDYGKGFSYYVNIEVKAIGIVTGCQIVGSEAFRPSWFKVWSDNGFFDTDERWKCWSYYPGQDWAARQFNNPPPPSRTYYRSDVNLVNPYCPGMEGPVADYIGTNKKVSYCRLACPSIELFIPKSLNLIEEIQIVSTRSFRICLSYDRLGGLNCEMYRSSKTCSNSLAYARDVRSVAVIMESYKENVVNPVEGLMIWSRTGLFNTDHMWRCSYEYLTIHGRKTFSWDKLLAVPYATEIGTNNPDNNPFGIGMPYVNSKAKWISARYHRKNEHTTSHTSMTCVLNRIAIARSRKDRKLVKIPYRFYGKDFRMPDYKDDNLFVDSLKMVLGFASSVVSLVVLKLIFSKMTFETKTEK